MTDEISAVKVTLKSSGFTLEELNERLTGFEQDANVELQIDDHCLAGLGAGLNNSCSIRIEGTVGDYALMLAENIDVDIAGDVGVGCGHSLVSGSVLIRGTASDYVGAYATGGLIAVHGQAGHGVALGLAGGDVLIRSRVGDYAGIQMRSGLLVLGNGAGEQLGAGMMGGAIFVRGEVASLAMGVKPVRMKDADSLRLSLLLARAGIKTAGAEFKLYRSTKSGAVR